MLSKRRTAPFLVLTWLGLALMAVPGCGTVKETNTARTGTEQLLLTSAFDSALQKVDFRPLTGVPVYLDTTNVTAVDQGWVVSSIRQAMVQQGVLLRAKPEQAQWIVEARVGAYGTDDYDLLIGVPQTTIPTTITGMPAGTIPEMPMLKRSNQQGVAKLALFAYDRSSGQYVWNSGTTLATSNAKNLFIGAIGPIQSGTIRGGTEFGGLKIPAGSERDSGGGPGARRPSDTSDPPALRLPANDLDSFMP